MALASLCSMPYGASEVVGAARAEPMAAARKMILESMMMRCLKRLLGTLEVEVLVCWKLVEVKRLC